MANISQLYLYTDLTIDGKGGVCYYPTLFNALHMHVILSKLSPKVFVMFFVGALVGVSLTILGIISPLVKGNPLQNISKSEIKNQEEKSANSQDTSTKIKIVNEGAEVIFEIDPIAGVTEASSEYINLINEYGFSFPYYPVAWLQKTKVVPSDLKEYVDPKLNVRFLYPANRGKLEFDPKNNEYFIRVPGGYHIDDWYPNSFSMNFSEDIALSSVGSGWVSPEHFCETRLVTNMPMSAVHGCFKAKESKLIGESIVHSWDNDAGYEVIEANVSLERSPYHAYGHPKFSSVKILFQYQDYEADKQTMLHIIDSVDLATKAE